MTDVSARFEGFDWDHGNWAKCQQYGVSIEEIETALRSGALLILPVTRHVDDEDRLIASGRGGSGRHIFVVFTLRQRGNAATGRCCDRSALGTCTRRRSPSMTKRVPRLRTDDEAEASSSRT
jgi:uncharacterized DUF497 family protein